MLPLSLLNQAQGQPIMVELKSGETLNGHLVNCDTWMNLTLKNITQTSANGENFQSIPEMYVRGNIIKYLRVPDEILDTIKEDRQNRAEQKNRFNNNNNQRGGGYRNNRQGGGGNRGGRFNNNAGGGGSGGNNDRGDRKFTGNRRGDHQGGGRGGHRQFDRN